MGNYNLKVYEYADGIQIRLYNQPITSYEKVLPVPLAKPYESNELKKVHTSELSPTVQEYIDYSNDMGTLITELQTVNQRLDTMTNIFIVGMIGIGLVVGILACNIFARYFIS